jgi:hypothetical protein
MHPELPGTAYVPSIAIRRGIAERFESDYLWAGRDPLGHHLCLSLHRPGGRDSCFDGIGRLAQGPA